MQQLSGLDLVFIVFSIKKGGSQIDTSFLLPSLFISCVFKRKAHYTLPGFGAVSPPYFELGREKAKQVKIQ